MDKDIEAEKPRGKFDFGGNLHELGKQSDAPFEAELIQSSSATACLWTIVFFLLLHFFSFSSWPTAESLYSCHLFTMSKMATAAVVAWFYELNSNKQRELMARGVEQSEKGNCYKRRQLVYSIYNILWWRHRVIGLLTKYNIYTW